MKSKASNEPLPGCRGHNWGAYVELVRLRSMSAKGNDALGSPPRESNAKGVGEPGTGLLSDSEDVSGIDATAGVKEKLSAVGHYWSTSPSRRRRCGPQFPFRTKA
jgi:hypothetical protein